MHTKKQIKYSYFFWLKTFNCIVSMTMIRTSVHSRRSLFEELEMNILIYYRITVDVPEHFKSTK